jgi:pimeloyl-ACP methyl ester carboxylesterase
MTEHLVEKPDPDLAWLDRPEVVRVLFYPRREPPNRPTPLRVRRVSFPVADGIEIHGRLHRAKLDGPTILLFHGNGEIAADYDGISPLYSEWGINLLVVDYRGYGNSDGQPNASHLLADAVAVFNQVSPLLVAHGLRARPLFIMGRSLGSRRYRRSDYRERLCPDIAPAGYVGVEVSAGRARRGPARVWQSGQDREYSNPYPGHPRSGRSSCTGSEWPRIVHSVWCR